MGITDDVFVKDTEDEVKNNTEDRDLMDDITKSHPTLINSALRAVVSNPEDIGQFDVLDKKRFLSYMSADFFSEIEKKAKKTTIRQGQQIFRVLGEYLEKNKDAREALLKSGWSNEHIENFIKNQQNTTREYNTQTKELVYNSIEVMDADKGIIDPTVPINKTSLFNEILRFFFFTEVLPPEVSLESFTGQSKQKGKFINMFNYSQVMTTEREIYADTQILFNSFINSLETGSIAITKANIEELEKNIHSLHTVFILFTVLWSMPFSEKDLGIQKITASLANLNENIIKFTKNIAEIEKRLDLDELSNDIKRQAEKTIADLHEFFNTKTKDDYIDVLNQIGVEQKEFITKLKTMRKNFEVVFLDLKERMETAEEMLKNLENMSKNSNIQNKNVDNERLNKIEAKLDKIIDVLNLKKEDEIKDKKINENKENKGFFKRFFKV